jgi:DNA polymerase-4
MVRKIIHLDMDAFYASIEQRNNPSLKNKPLVIGGMPDSRGVVSTCSYEARKYGIHSAMPSSKAARLCPDAIFMKPSMERYKKESAKIFEIYKKFTDFMEPLSLDEAFLDVTEDKASIGSAAKTAAIIKKEVLKKTNLTVSAGVSYNKFLAKLASDLEKPDGLTVITPDKGPALIKDLPVEKFFGIGKATSAKMHQHSIFTGKDILKTGEQRLCRLFGKHGRLFYLFASGHDPRPVSWERIRKSCGREITFQQDIKDKNIIIDIIKKLCVKVAEILKRNELKACTATLKIRYFDFYTITRSKTESRPFTEAEDIFKRVYPLLDKTEIGEKSVRLLGVTASNFESETKKPVQLCFDFSSIESVQPDIV